MQFENRPNNGSIAFQLALVSDSIFIIFSAVIVISLLPIRILNPIWAAQLVQSLLDNSLNPLIGMAILNLACYLDPENPHLKSRKRIFAFFCCYVAVGFLLLIPIQASSAWRIYKQEQAIAVTQYDIATRRINKFISEVKRSADVDQLARTLKSFQGVSLTNQDRLRTLSDLKNILLEKSISAKQILANRRNPQALSEKAFLQIQISLRNSLVAIGYTLGFAALAQLPRSDGPWLQEIFASIANKLEDLLRKREMSLAEIHERQAIQSAEALPEAALNFERLEKQGLIDSRWLDPQESGTDKVETTRLEDPFVDKGSAPLQRLLRLPVSFIASVTHLFNRKSHLDYIHHLAAEAETDPEAALDNSNTIHPSSISADAPARGRQQPTVEQQASSQMNRQRFRDRDIADFEYFNALANQTEDNVDPDTKSTKK